MTTFEEFETLVGRPKACEFFQLVSDSCYGRLSSERNASGVLVTDVVTLNACNHIYSGSALYEGIEIFFEIESGDHNGTVIHRWSLTDDKPVKKSEPPLYKFVPIFSCHSNFQAKLLDEVYYRNLFAAYLEKCKIGEFKELEREFNYDMYFQPGAKVNRAYEEKARKLGLQAVTDQRYEEIIAYYRKVVQLGSEARFV